ncbi:hypothetical protein D3C81_1195800 [compost metagenome]
MTAGYLLVELAQGVLVEVHEEDAQVDEGIGLVEQQHAREVDALLVQFGDARGA